MPDEQRRYHSYLLRLWQAGGEHAPSWRASLEDVQTGERHSFVDLAQLFAFLEAQAHASARESDSSTVK